MPDFRKSKIAVDILREQLSEGPDGKLRWTMTVEEAVTLTQNIEGVVRMAIVRDAQQRPNFKVIQ